MLTDAGQGALSRFKSSVVRIDSQTEDDPPNQQLYDWDCKCDSASRVDAWSIMLKLLASTSYEADMASLWALSPQQHQIIVRLCFWITIVVAASSTDLSCLLNAVLLSEWVPQVAGTADAT